MVSTDSSIRLMNINKIKENLAKTKTLSTGVKLTPLVTVTTPTPAGKTLYQNVISVKIQRPLEIVKSAQEAKAKSQSLKSVPKGVNQIIGGVAGVALGVALQNPLLSREQNQKILIQSTEQGLSGGIGKVAGVIPAGLGGTVGYAISGTPGITQGVTQGPIQTITNTLQKEYVERIETIKETVTGGADLFKGAGEFLQKYGLWIALGIGAIILLPPILNIFGGKK